MPAWLVWLIVAAVLATAETMSMDLVLAMCAAGALAGSICALVGLPVAVQFVVAFAVGGSMLFLVRPIAKRHLQRGGQPTGVDLLIGKNAVVLTRVSAESGLVRLNGGEWTARAFDEAQVIEAGQTVQVMKISGATAVVWAPPEFAAKPAQPLDPTQ
ncbi:membrane protein implicated in regulation of membrane protease activity [Jatrophihabitans sp. GAS493]|uniref:NfeD family protein n=1 Tax=Jatrophihabitans sp. GAS493 TaxID=1907575 RepID=UPI000BB72FB6|nr:NfeD family protein [Jatrophihabitans sp. GAS493]SOD73964.1 membrane protein implicated in regulation of membrane protease activity [Jatrophihabitans sp. GAS493]